MFRPPLRSVRASSGPFPIALDARGASRTRCKSVSAETRFVTSKPALPVEDPTRVADRYIGSPTSSARLSKDRLVTFSAGPRESVEALPPLSSSSLPLVRVDVTCAKSSDETTTRQSLVLVYGGGGQGCPFGGSRNSVSVAVPSKN